MNQVQVRQAAHRIYTEGVVRLMVFYVWHLSRVDGQRPVRSLLDTHVDIMRKTTLFDGRHPSPEGLPNSLDPPIPEWDELKGRLDAQITSHAGRESAALEDTCWRILEPVIEPRLTELPKIQYTYGCWEYDVLEEYPNVVNLHFVNAYQPESPFRSHRGKVAATLRRLVEEAHSEKPELEYVWCFSWLNWHSPFASLFPEAWQTTFNPTERHFANDGWWGQYMDCRGGLHNGRAERLRSTGSHPYKVGICMCPIREAIEHLDEVLAVGSEV